MKLKFIKIFAAAILTLLFAANALFAAEASKFAAPSENGVSRVYVADLRSHNKEWGFRHKDGVVLVLCGGGTKGFAHIGVFEILERENIPIAAIVGTSMGSIMGGLYASGWTPAEMRKVLAEVNLMEIMSGRRDSSPLTDIKTTPPKNNQNLFGVTISEKGQVNSRKALLRDKEIYNFLSELTQNVHTTDFNKLNIPFAAVATDIENGDTVVMRSGNLASALRASMSIPGLFEPWQRDGRWLVDGGLNANLPVIEAKKIFPGHPVVAVNLSPTDISRPMEQMKGMMDIASHTLDILMLQQVRDNVAAADLVISPDVSSFSMLDAGGYDKVMDEGTKAVEAKVEELHKLIDEYHEHIRPSLHEGPPRERVTVVTELDVTGVGKSAAHEIRERYEDWVGKPLDMTKVTAAIKELSKREEFTLVEPHVENSKDGTSKVTLNMRARPKYEASIGGYTSNYNLDRWTTISAIARDVISEGDSADIELHAGKSWAVLMRYFTPRTSHDTQLGLTLTRRKEVYSLRNAYSDPYDYADEASYYRTTGRAMWYKNFGPNNSYRLGLGWGLAKADMHGEDSSMDGFLLSFGINTLDDPIIPTKGLSLQMDIWFPESYKIISETRFTAHLFPKFSWNTRLSGGLYTGDLSDVQTMAILGARDELYTLAGHPLYGEEAYWISLAANRVLMKSWWGGINTELFGTFAQTMLSNWEDAVSWWEVGLKFSIPTNLFPGSLIMAYGRGSEWVFGYSIGMPRWLKGPLP